MFLSGKDTPCEGSVNPEPVEDLQDSPVAHVVVCPLPADLPGAMSAFEAGIPVVLVVFDLVPVDARFLAIADHVCAPDRLSATLRVIGARVEVAA